MTNKLKAATEDLYKLFSKYPATNMQGSPVYQDLDKWNYNLLSKPLRKLTDEDLSKYSGSALTTWGDAVDYKHFLPRILELIAEFKPPYMIWVSFDKLEMAEWQKWPKEEQDAIRKYMLDLWDNLLKSENWQADLNFNDYFSSLAHFYPDFSDLIEIWKNNKGKSAIKHLVKFIFNEKQEIFDKGVLRGLYDQIENVEELKEWLLSTQVIDRLQKAYFRFETEEPELAEKISWAEKILSDKKRNASNKYS